MEENDNVATAREVLVYWTEVMRNDSGTLSMKASELLGKRYGLLTEQMMTAEPPVIIDDLAQPRETAAGPEPGSGADGSTSGDVSGADDAEPVPKQEAAR